MLSTRPVGIVGLGAIGTSIGLALRAAGEVTLGYDASIRHLEQSAGLGAISGRLTRLEDFSSCKAVFVAVPPGAIIEASRRLLEETDSTVIDVGSVKVEIADAIRDRRFVPSHPLRGTHLSGPTGGRKDLFVGATWAVCPTPSTCPNRLVMAESLIRSMGAVPLKVEASDHDNVMARTSHLPHVAASSLVHVLGTRDQALARQMVGGGFLDTTRIARASPSLWADITLHNRSEVSRSISEMVSRLQAVKEAIEEGDRESVLDFFADACRLVEDCWPQPRVAAGPEKVHRVSGAFSTRNRRREALTRELGGVH